MQAAANISTSLDHWSGHQRHSAHQFKFYTPGAQLIRDTRFLNVSSVAALALLVYDMILCFEDELSWVWNRWNEPKGRHSRRIYVAIRYASVLNLALYVAGEPLSNLVLIFLSDPATNSEHELGLEFELVRASLDLSLHYLICVALFTVALRGIMSLSFVVTLLPDILILIRINAANDWNPTYLLLTASLFFVQLTTSLGIGFTYVSSSKITRPDNPLIPGCRISPGTLSPYFTLAAWIPSIIIQCVYFMLIVIMFANVLVNLSDKGRPNITTLREVRAHVPTMHIFIKHGIIYFSLAILAKVINALIITSASGPLQGAGISWMMAIYPIVITRLKLDLSRFIHSMEPRLPPLLIPSNHRTGSMTFSFVQPSPHFDSGPITFASRTSRISRTSRFDTVSDY